MKDTLEKIAQFLDEQYPQVQFKVENKSEMKIPSKEKMGFDISVEFMEEENTLHFGSGHFHFENDEGGKVQFFDFLMLAMSRLGRLKVYSRNKKEYKWTFEIKNEDNGQWQPANTMGLLNFKFWQKTEIKYYQNELIDFGK